MKGSALNGSPTSARLAANSTAGSISYSCSASSTCLRLFHSPRSNMNITPGDLTDPQVIDLLSHHLTSARAQTAPGSAHALDLEALQSPDVMLWTAWDEETLV